MMVAHFLNDFYLYVSATVPEFNRILQNNNLDIIPGTQMVNSYHSDFSGVQHLDTDGEALDPEADPKAIESCDIDEKVSFTEDPQSCTVDNIFNSDENRLVVSDSTPHDIRQASLTKAENTDLDVTRDAEEEKLSSALEASHHSSFDISNPQEVSNLHCVVDSPKKSEISASPSSHSISEVAVDFPTVTPIPSCGFQRLRKWWKQQKSDITRFSRACCPCAKKKSGTKE